MSVKEELSEAVTATLIRFAGRIDVEDALIQLGRSALGIIAFEADPETSFEDWVFGMRAALPALIEEREKNFPGLHAERFARAKG